VKGCRRAVEPHTSSYDLGNRLSSLSIPSYAYNSSNEVTAVGSASSYTYDNNGNTLTKADSTETTIYTWDFENRLTSVHPPGQTTVTFKYDPFGKRIEKGGSVYLYDGANLIEEADASGNLTAGYVFGSGIDEPLAVNRGATWEFYQADGLGSITSLCTTTGTVSDSFVYDSFGTVGDQAEHLGLHQGSGEAAQPPVNPPSLHRAVDRGFLLPFHTAAGESVRMEGTRSGAAILRSPRQIPASPFISEGDSTAKGTPHNHPYLPMLAKTWFVH
jgi:YD repeat-containing protein